MKYNILALLITLLGLVALHYNVEYAGWVLFTGLVCLWSCVWEEDDD